MFLGIGINVPCAQIISASLTWYYFYLPLKYLHLQFCVSCIAALQDCMQWHNFSAVLWLVSQDMSNSAVWAGIQHRLVLQLWQAHPHICSTVSDSKSCFKMEFQVFHGIFCTASLSGVEGGTAAVVRSCLGSGDGHNQGKQWWKHQLEVDRVYSLPFAEVLMSP